MTSAIKIVRPSPTDSSPTLTPAIPKKVPVEAVKLCRNITIYGECKFENKGCVYSHGIQSNLTVNNEEFIPSFTTPTPNSNSLTIQSQEFIPKQLEYEPDQALVLTEEGKQEFDYIDEQYYEDTEPIRESIQYHQYHPPPSNLNLKNSKFNFLAPELHISLTQRTEDLSPYSSLPHSQHINALLPKKVGNYIKLQFESEEILMGTNFQRISYRAIDANPSVKNSGIELVSMVRVGNWKLKKQESIAMVEKLTKLDSAPGLVRLREAFTTRVFGDDSIIFIYDFQPGVENIIKNELSTPSSVWRTSSIQPHQQRYHNSYKHSSTSPNFSGISESILWSIIVQLVSIIKFLEDNSVDPSRGGMNESSIKYIGTNRIGLFYFGILELLNFDSSNGTNEFNGRKTERNKNDFTSLAKFLISLTKPQSSQTLSNNLNRAVEELTPIYSTEFCQFLYTLINPQSNLATLYPLLTPHLFSFQATLLQTSASLEQSLSTQLESSRLFKLVIKLNFIKEKGQLGGNLNWSETGDRYLIGLGFDYIFGRVTEDGKAELSLGWVIACLNKLDAGSEEKILLVSRDEQNCLIVSYRELKNCIESAFLDLSR